MREASRRLARSPRRPRCRRALRGVALQRAYVPESEPTRVATDQGQSVGVDVERNHLALLANKLCELERLCAGCGTAIDNGFARLNSQQQGNKLRRLILNCELPLRKAPLLHGVRPKIGNPAGCKSAGLPREPFLHRLEVGPLRDADGPGGRAQTCFS
jgi:hypothetical protein